MIKPYVKYKLHNPPTFSNEYLNQFFKNKNLKNKTIRLIMVFSNRNYCNSTTYRIAAVNKSVWADSVVFA